MTSKDLKNKMSIFKDNNNKKLTIYNKTNVRYNYNINYVVPKYW